MFDDMKSRAAKRLHDPQRPAMLRAWARPKSRQILPPRRRIARAAAGRPRWSSTAKAGAWIVSTHAGPAAPEN